MKKIMIYGLLLVLGFIVFITGKEIYSYLKDSTTTKGVVFTVGKVSFKMDGSLKDGGLVVPSENLVTSPFILTNKSTVSSELRMKIEIKINNVVATSEELEHTIDLDLWTYNAVDGYYYLNDVVTHTTTSITVLKYIALDGSVVRNNYTGLKVSVHFVFHAKQKDYVTWETLGDTTFTFGD